MNPRSPALPTLLAMLRTIARWLASADRQLEAAVRRLDAAARPLIQSADPRLDQAARWLADREQAAAPAAAAGRRRADPLLAGLRPTLDRLRPVAAGLDPLVDRLGPVLDRLGPVTARLGPVRVRLAAAARRLAAALRPALGWSHARLGDAERLADRSPRLRLAVAVAFLAAAATAAVGLSVGAAAPASALSHGLVGGVVSAGGPSGSGSGPGYAVPGPGSGVAAGGGAAAPAVAAGQATTDAPYLIYDSVTPAAIPAGHPVATYASGRHPVPASQVAGRGPVLWIDTTGGDYHASALDVEPGNASPATAATWTRDKLTADPHALARIYTMLSQWPATKAAVATLPASMQAHVRWWIADPTGQPHLVPGSSATQWYWGPNYDISTAAPGF